MLAARAATSSMRCSQVSRIRRILLSRSQAIRFGRASAEPTGSPSMEAMAVVTSPGSLSIPRSTNSVAPPKASLRRWATATATVVLPTPPAPTMVTKWDAVS